MSFNKISPYIVFLLALVLTSGAQSHEHDFRLLTYIDPPYVYPADSDEKGLAVLLIEQLMSRAGFTYTLDIYPPKRSLLVALATPGTCVFPIERSQEREVQYSWVSPILFSSHGLYQRANTSSAKLRSLSDAQNMTIGTYLGSGIGEYLRGLGFTVEETANNESNILKLAANRIDLWASDTLSAQYIADTKNIALDKPELVFFTSLRAMACHPLVSGEKIQLLNQTLKTMYQDGSVEKLRQRFDLMQNKH